MTTRMPFAAMTKTAQREPTEDLHSGRLSGEVPWRSKGVALFQQAPMPVPRPWRIGPLPAVTAPIQRKATVSVPSDPLEKAADEGAEKLMRMEAPGATQGASETIARQCATCEEEEDKIHGKRDAGAESARDTTTAIRAAERPGEPLPRETRDFFEPRMGTDLSGVRIHADAEAARAAASVQAKAYTWRDKIVFGAGEYAPQTEAGKKLIAHELMHVGQQEDRAEQSEQVQRQASAGSTQVFDADYLLYRSNEGTRYESKTQAYYLSSWDIAHLTRISGFYFLRSSTLSLIVPPEARQAAKGNAKSVLMDIKETDLDTIRQGGATAVQAIISRELGISVPKLTASTGANRDFSVAVLPNAVTNVLDRPSSSSDPGIEAARRSARAAAQEKTLDIAHARHEELPMQSLTLSDFSHPLVVRDRSDAKWAAWFVQVLGRFQAQLYESATRNYIPMQLLAAVILAELVDIGVSDIVQDNPSTYDGSLGIAQIKIDTALQDHLLDMDESQAAEGYRRAGLHTHGSLTPEMVEIGTRLRAGQLLQVPQIAIEAAAREIALLLRRAGANQDKPWQRQHGFKALGPLGNAIYSQVGMGSQMEREMSLASLVAGAYNSPDIIITSDPLRYDRGLGEARNGAGVAKRLFNLGLFRTM